jgi:hypothetical protein
MSNAMFTTSLTRLGMICAWTSVSRNSAGLTLISSSYGRQSESSMKSKPYSSNDPYRLSSRSLTCRNVSFITSLILSVTFDLNSASDVIYFVSIKYEHKLLGPETFMAANCFNSAKRGCFFCTLRFVRWVSLLTSSGLRPGSVFVFGRPKLSREKSIREMRQ